MPKSVSRSRSRSTSGRCSSSSSGRCASSESRKSQKKAHRSPRNESAKKARRSPSPIRRKRCNSRSKHKCRSRSRRVSHNGHSETGIRREKPVLKARVQLSRAHAHSSTQVKNGYDGRNARSEDGSRRAPPSRDTRGDDWSRRAPQMQDVRADDGSDSSFDSARGASPETLAARTRAKMGVVYWGGGIEGKGWDIDGYFPKIDYRTDALLDSWKGRLENAQMTLRMCASEGPGFKRYMRHFTMLSAGACMEYRLQQWHKYNREKKKKVLTERIVIGAILEAHKGQSPPDSGLRVVNSRENGSGVYAKFLSRRARRYRRQAHRLGGHFAAVILEGGCDELKFVSAAKVALANTAQEAKIMRLLVILGGPDGISSEVRESIRVILEEKTDFPLIGVALPGGILHSYYALATVFVFHDQGLLIPYLEARAGSPRHPVSAPASTHGSNTRRNSEPRARRSDAARREDTSAHTSLEASSLQATPPCDLFLGSAPSWQKEEKLTPLPPTVPPPMHLHQELMAALEEQTLPHPPIMPPPLHGSIAMVPGVMDPGAMTAMPPPPPPKAMPRRHLLQQNGINIPAEAVALSTGADMEAIPIDVGGVLTPASPALFKVPPPVVPVNGSTAKAPSMAS